MRSLVPERAEQLGFALSLKSQEFHFRWICCDGMNLGGGFTSRDEGMASTAHASVQLVS